MTMPDVMYLDFSEEPDYVSASHYKHDEDYHKYIRADLAEELARAALQVTENYGFTSDGNDGYREVETEHINELEKALARYRALTP